MGVKFKKGNSGRPKGSLNKLTVQAKEAFLTVMELLEKRMTDKEDVIENLSPARAAELYVNMLNYIKPKLSATKNENLNENSGTVKFLVEFVDENKPQQEDNGNG